LFKSSTNFYKRAKPSAFFRRETVVVDIGFGIGKVNFRVRHVEVTAKNHGFFLFQFFKVTQKISVPTLAVSEAGKVAPGVWNVNIHEKKVFEFSGKHTAFVVVFSNADVGGDI
jgi:hypothetical protein